MADFTDHSVSEVLSALYQKADNAVQKVTSVHTNARVYGISVTGEQRVFDFARDAVAQFSC